MLTGRKLKYHGALLYGEHATFTNFPKYQESMLEAQNWYIHDIKSVYFDDYAKKMSAL